MLNENRGLTEKTPDIGIYPKSGCYIFFFVNETKISNNFIVS